mgnify:CR=1 FL=1
MELNRKIDRLLTKEQKTKFQIDNGKFKILNNIVLLPVITALLGIYLESIIIVSISILGIIAFLVCKIFSFKKKNVVYEETIIPAVLKEKFQDIQIVKDDNLIEEEFKRSNIIPDFKNIDVEKSFAINKEKYSLNLSKIIVKKLNIEENDGVVDKDIEEKFNGVFIYVKLPVKTSTSYRVIDKKLEIDSDSKVKITNYDFDSVYDVFSTEQAEVRGILSAGIMARILEFNAKIGGVINFSINEDMLYVAVDYKKFLEFKGNGKKYIDEPEALRNLEMLEILDLFVTYFFNIYEK